MTSGTNEPLTARIWFKFDPTEWESSSFSTDSVDEVNVQRAYDSWRHADGLCTAAANEFVRIDIVTNLKRCIAQRISLLKETYALKNLARTARWRNVEDLEVLANLGLVRPLLLRKLHAIRNAVEHENASPPSAEECRDFVELVWYFLKSTDSTVREIRSDYDLICWREGVDPVPDLDPVPSIDGERVKVMDLREPTPRAQISIDYPTDTWLPAIRGKLPASKWSRMPVDGWLELRCGKLTTDDAGNVRFQGQGRGPIAVLITMWRSYFARD
jgi:hypothetical protein